MLVSEKFICNLLCNAGKRYFKRAHRYDIELHLCVAAKFSDLLLA